MEARLHYDPEVDIAFLSIEKGRAVSDEYAWGLIDRDPEDGHLMGFEVWQASKVLPPEVVAALPRPGDSSGGGPAGWLRPTAA